MIAVSDIHGHVHYLKGLLEKLAFSGRDTLIIIGDMIEKGPKNLETVRYIMDLMDNGHNVYVSMGNVEYHRLSHFMDDSEAGNRTCLEMFRTVKNVWKDGLFLDMFDELGISLDELDEDGFLRAKRRVREHFKQELDFLGNLPTVLTAGNFIFVHGGILTESLDELQKQEAFSLLKMDAFLKKDVKFEKYVVVGHWPVCLYRDDEDSMNPIYDEEKHIISIDGGCGLKYGAQLNALVLPEGAEDMDHAYFDAFDDLPVIVAPRSQEAKGAAIHIRYFDCSVEILENLGDMVRVRHVSTGREFVMPESYLYYRPGKLPQCNDYSDCWIQVEKGEELSVVERTSVGLIVKKQGRVGWYFGDDVPIDF